MANPSCQTLQDLQPSKFKYIIKLFAISYVARWQVVVDCRSNGAS